MPIKGAGGTPGGIGKFFIGFIMMCGGFYMLLQSIIVTQQFSFGMGLFHVMIFGGSLSITSGMIMIPMLFGIGMIFYNARNFIGWALAIGSLAALVFGVISNTHFALRTMTAFELIIILVLSIGGLGLFLQSLRSSSTDNTAKK